MDFTDWMLMELDQNERKKVGELAAPYAVIKQIAVVFGGVCLAVGVILCIVYSVQLEMFLWYYLLAGFCGGVLGAVAYFICQAQINKMYVQVRLLREMHAIASKK